MNGRIKQRLYYDRNGARIPKEKWEELNADDVYRTVKLYENEDVRVLVRWLGFQDDAPHVFRDMWKIFEIGVWNRDDELDKWVPDPVENGKTFAYEHIAIAHYEKFLMEWTESRKTPDGGFVEVGNKFEPPPPPNPDAPTTDVADMKWLDDDDVGAW